MNNMNKRKERAKLVRALSMVSGFSISMITPIALCLAVALLLKKHFGIPNGAVVFAVVLGAASSFWNMIKIIKSVSDLKKDE